ncbi:hypothetical protein [Reyranella sp.]|uniref:hypothetical protein n=1 Tax=Reyranella sp. TaxID=1929291 RepID=UPI003D12BF1C
MFTSLLTNLQNLIASPSRFFIGSFLPVLAFWFFNALMLYLFNAPFQKWASGIVEQSGGLATVVFVAVLIAIVFSAYAESALLPTIQSVMEGGNWPSWIAWFFVPAEMRRYERLERLRKRNADLLGRFGTTAAGSPQAEEWKKSLLTARTAGYTQAANGYRRTEQSGVAVDRLAGLRRRARSISGGELEQAVTLVVLALRANNANRAGPPDHGRDLDNVHTLLITLIEYAEEYATNQYRLLVTRGQFDFGALPLAPTRMGNVARTVQNYAVQRYDFNFELFWSRLQLPVQKDKDFGPVLLGAKTQLDFLVSCSALTFLWTVIWGLWLFLSSGPVELFMGVAVLGPLAAYFWYRIAVAQYRTLNDLLRSSIDLFRFDLLASLGYPKPDAVLQERELWGTIDALHALHEMRDLRYMPPKSS